MREPVRGWVVLQVLGHVAQEQQIRLLHSSWTFSDAELTIQLSMLKMQNWLSSGKAHVQLLCLVRLTCPEQAYIA